jgi:hypothetical protein
MSRKFWMRAVDHFVFTSNVTPRWRNGIWISAHERYHGREPVSMSRLLPFGCEIFCTTHSLNVERAGMEEIRRRYVFLGYDDDTAVNYRVWDPLKRKTYVVAEKTCESNPTVFPFLQVRVLRHRASRRQDVHALDEELSLSAGPSSVSSADASEQKESPFHDIYREADEHLDEHIEQLPLKKREEWARSVVEDMWPLMDKVNTRQAQKRKDDLLLAPPWVDDDVDLHQDEVKDEGQEMDDPIPLSIRESQLLQQISEPSSSSPYSSVGELPISDLVESDDEEDDDEEEKAMGAHAMWSRPNNTAPIDGGLITASFCHVASTREVDALVLRNRPGAPHISLGTALGASSSLEPPPGMVIDPETVKINMIHQAKAIGGNRENASNAVLCFFSPTRESLQELDNIYGFTVMAQAARLHLGDLDQQVPTSWKELKGYPEETRKKWIEAFMLESKNLLGLDALEEVDLPAGGKVLGVKVVFAIKRGDDLSITKYKVRVTGQGFRQVEGVHYLESFAPCVRLESFRLMLALAAIHRWHTAQGDVTAAYLHADLEEGIGPLYAEIPDGWKGKDQPKRTGPRRRVLRIKKALYGLVQSGACWHKLIKSKLLEDGWIASKYDQCFFYRKDKNGATCALLCLYVDDVAIAYRDEHIKDDLDKLLANEFTFDGMEPLEWFLGMRIRQSKDKSQIFLDNEAYTTQVLFQHGHLTKEGVPRDKKKCDRPFVDLQLDMTYLPTQEESAKLATLPFREILGQVMYVSLRTRPDIAWAVGQVATRSAKPTMKAWSALQQILGYLARHPARGIRYDGRVDATWTDIGREAQGMADANYAGCEQTRVSTSGVMLMLARGLVDYASLRQRIVALSTTESELISLAEATRRGLWLVRILEEVGFGRIGMGPSILEPLKIWEDNMGVVHTVKSDRQSKRLKHMDVRYHFTRFWNREGYTCSPYRSTVKMLADILTKGTTLQIFNTLNKELTHIWEEW